VDTVPIHIKKILLKIQYFKISSEKDWYLVTLNKFMPITNVKGIVFVKLPCIIQFSLACYPIGQDITFISPIGEQRLAAHDPIESGVHTSN